MNKSKQFLIDVEYRVHRIKHFAKKYGWHLKSDNREVFTFISSDYAILKIDYWKMKIETSLSHPLWGDTVLIRKGDFTQKIIESIFRNPRAHMPVKKVKSEYVKCFSILKS